METSGVSAVIAGQTKSVNKVSMGGGLTLVCGHVTVTGVAMSASTTGIKIQQLPRMSTVLACGVEAMQIGQASSYTTYPHFSVSGELADFYIRNTTAGTSAIEVNFFVLGHLF